MFGRGVFGGYYVFGAEAVARQLGRLQRNRLRRRGPLSGNVALGNGPLFDTEHWLPGYAIENEHVSQLADLSQRRNLFAVLHDVDQSGSGRKIVIPDVVMDRLEIPFQFSGRGIHGRDRVAEKVGA